MLERETAHGLLVAYAIPPPNEREQVELWALLPEQERQLGSAYGAKRRVTFAAGRVALRHALARLGLGGSAPILRTARGAPEVPQGASGSISHKSSIACALAAAEEQGAIGIDVELAEPGVDRVAALVLTEIERRAVEDRPSAERSFEVLLRLSLKEALYKAIDPFVQRFVGFREVEAWPELDGSAGFSVGSSEDLRRLEADGRWFRESGRVFTSARARMRSAL